MAQGETRNFCTPVIISRGCRRLNFVISLHDANYNVCCSQPRSIAWWDVADPQVPNGGLSIRPSVPFDGLLLQDAAGIARIDFYVDDVWSRSITQAPWQLDSDITLTPGPHQLRYSVTSFFGEVIWSRNVTVNPPAGAALPSTLVLDMNKRSTDGAMVLSWSAPTAILQTCSSLTGPWELMNDTPSPYIITDFSEKSRFYRLYRP